MEGDTNFRAITGVGFEVTYDNAEEYKKLNSLFPEQEVQLKKMSGFISLL